MNAIQVRKRSDYYKSISDPNLGGNPRARTRANKQKLRPADAMARGRRVRAGRLPKFSVPRKARARVPVEPELKVPGEGVVSLYNAVKLNELVRTLKTSSVDRKKETDEFLRKIDKLYQDKDTRTKPPRSEEVPRSEEGAPFAPSGLFSGLAPAMGAPSTFFSDLAGVTVPASEFTLPTASRRRGINTRARAEERAEPMPERPGLGEAKEGDVDDLYR